jgi:hypothetical protein
MKGCVEKLERFVVAVNPGLYQNSLAAWQNCLSESSSN